MALFPLSAVLRGFLGCNVKPYDLPETLVRPNGVAPSTGLGLRGTRAQPNNCLFLARIPFVPIKFSWMGTIYERYLYLDAAQSAERDSAEIQTL